MPLSNDKKINNYESITAISKKLISIIFNINFYMFN